jgi:uncharacterized protein YjcR
MAEKSRKKDGGQRYDWDLIKIDYVTNSDSSLRKIAEKYGIRFPTIQKKAKADSWFATKQEYRKKAQTKALSKACTKKANELAGLVQASDYIEKAILKAFNDPEYFRKHIVSRNLNEEQDTLDILNTKAMKDMMRVIKDVEDVKRSILDIRKADAAERLEIEKARLALEQERLELEKARAEYNRPDSTNSIRIDGFEIGWSE